MKVLQETQYFQCRFEYINFSHVEISQGEV